MLNIKCKHEVFPFMNCIDLHNIHYTIIAVRNCSEIAKLVIGFQEKKINENCSSFLGKRLVSVTMYHVHVTPENLYVSLIT